MKAQVATSAIESIGVRSLRSWWFLGLVSAVIVGTLILASWPWWLNRFVLRATTRVIEISASAPAVHEIGVSLPKDSEIQIIRPHPDGLPPELSALATSISVRLVASSVTVQAISLPSGAGLVIRTSDHSTDIGVLNDGNISVALSGTIQLIDEYGHLSPLANVGRATVWNIKPAERNSTARLVLPQINDPIALYNQPISDFWFRLPRPANDDPRTLQSEISQGELLLLETNVRIALSPRELVLLEGGRRVLSRLEVVQGAIAVDLLGEAERISVGPPRPGTPFRLDRNITPSLLSYVVNQHELKLLWGLALAIIGALWKAREWALRWKE